GGKLLYDSRRAMDPKFLRGHRAQIYKADKPIGERAEGSLMVGPDGVITINRVNATGRFEIQLRPQGPSRPSFRKIIDPPPRQLRVTCEVKAEDATHRMRFVAKDEQSDKWLADETWRIEAGDWQPIEFSLWVDPAKDFLFRIDDEEPSKAPTKLLIRNLTVE